MGKYYIIENVGKKGPRRFLTYGGGMITDFLFWSHEWHALIFAESTLKDERLQKYLEGVDYKLIPVIPSEKKGRKQYYLDIN